MQVMVEANPVEEDVQRIHDGRAVYNAQHTKMDGFQRLMIFVRSDGQGLGAGVTQL